MSYSIAYSREKEHAEALKRGLAKMPPGFTAELCALCDGRGARGTYDQACEYCGGHGLRQGVGRPYAWKNPAPVSVVNQVLRAGGGEMVRSEFCLSVRRPRQPAIKP